MSDTQNDIETFGERQFACPYCGEEHDLEYTADELVDGEGSHQCDCIIGYCRRCEEEWIEPADEEDQS